MSIKVEFENLLDQGNVYTHINSLLPEVIVPQDCRQPHLVLEIGSNLIIPIPDLYVDEYGFTCTVSFNRKPHWCSIPWAAVFAVVPVGKPEQALVRNVSAAELVKEQRPKLKAERPYLKLVKD